MHPYVDYAGNPITDAAINTTVKDAILVWQDAYHIVDSVRFDTSPERQIVFHVDPTYLPQANCVLSIRDADEKIIWSWHIWITDHWVNDDLVLGKLNGREADVECEAEDLTKGPFALAPYNLGWCDPKNVLYIKRSGSMMFKHFNEDKTTQLAVKPLDVIQRADEIEYWIGNSTYYQFGRKDPMVGFINAQNEEKYNFGSMPYTSISTTDLTVQDCILTPNTFFDTSAWMDDWQMSKFYNLWNNYNSSSILGSGVITTTVPNKKINAATLAKWEYLLGPEATEEEKKQIPYGLTFTNFETDGQATIVSGNPNLTSDFAYAAIKTIYDPSPAGYVVPPIGFFQVFGIGNPNSGAFGAVA